MNNSRQLTSSESYSHHKQVVGWSVTTMSSDSDELDFVYCSTNRKLYVKADQIGGWEHTRGIYLLVKLINYCVQYSKFIVKK